MATDDDALDAERSYRILDAGRDAACRGRVGRYDVADIAHDENIARLPLSEKLRHHAAIRASDEHGEGGLRLAELSEQITLGAVNVSMEAQNAIDEPVHRPPQVFAQSFISFTKAFQLTMSACTGLERRLSLVVAGAADHRFRRRPSQPRRAKHSVAAAIVLRPCSSDFARKRLRISWP